MPLKTLATYRLSSCVSLLLARGSVLEFVPAVDSTASAIVNAANPSCLGGGGVDGAITAAGGPNLAADRQKLPLKAPGLRCPTGSAVRTGPNHYGELPTPYVIHAVGPNYSDYEDEIDLGHALLQSAYQQSLDLVAESGCDQVAFPLLSAGVYRGDVPLPVVLELAVGAIQEWALLPPTTLTTMRRSKTMEVTLCAFSPNECQTLLRASERLLGQS